MTKSMITRLFMTCLTVFLAALTTFSQRKLPPYTEEVLNPEMFTAVLKDEWFYVKDETDAYLKSIEKRGEFETSAEFENRVSQTRAEFVKKVNDHIKDRKLLRRVFSVMLKASLKSYDADQGVYSVTCPAVAEVPYDIPTVETFVPTNAYVVLSDTISRGYRVSRLSVKLDPDFKWKVDRSTAIQAKSEEGNIFFRVRMMLDIRQNGITNQAKFCIVAKDISLFNEGTKLIYWKELLQ
jgi:hypothetical protein